MSSNNKYRVGDFVYFEVSATAPYQIRRLDELIMTPSGVEAKVTCYFRRRDISNTLIQQAEKYYFQETDDSSSESSPSLSDLQRHQIKHRELFYSRTMEGLPATHIRGKCTVVLYNDVEPMTSYVEREDTFYYRLIYDPNTKRLQEDRGSMRIGSDFQSDIQPLLAKGENDPRFEQSLEELRWNPVESLLPTEVDTFVTAVKAIGLYGRACDPATCQRQPLLINAATSACRDITLQFAHDTLFKVGFNVQKAMALLLPEGQPVVCKDELEAWTVSETELFEEALGKYMKVFPDILTDFVPWKTPKSIVEFYYFWKTTDRYIRHRKAKMVAKEAKLKQVYIPDYSKPNSAVLYNRTDGNDRGCECCYVKSSPQWYAWGPPNLMCRLCSGCWTYWKKYGGLKNPDKRDRLEARNSAANAPTSTSSYPPNSQANAGVDHRRAPSHHPVADGCLTSTVYRCNQPDCVKEFRSKDNLVIHLAQVHSVTGHSSANLVDTALGDGDGGGGGGGGGQRDVLPPSATGVFQHGAGTQCFLTPLHLRIVRTLCPLLLRPAVLARRPNKLANSTAQQRPTSDPIMSTDELIRRLKTQAKSRIPALRDPQAVLHRKLPARLLTAVIKKLNLRTNNNNNSLVDSTSSATVVSLKRLREESGGTPLSNGEDCASEDSSTIPAAVSMNGDDQALEKRLRAAAAAATTTENGGDSNGHVTV